jgi:hypothetical protein
MRVIIEAWSETPGIGRYLSEPEDHDYKTLTWRYERLRIDGYTSFTAHRLDIVCDFCSYPAVVYRYEITPGGIMGTFWDGERQVTHIDRDGKWAACMECATCIAQRDWDALLERSVESLVEKSGLPVEVCRAMNKGPHGCFRRSYRGEKPITVESDMELMENE